MMFSKKCYNLLKKVPRGKVVSYKQIAEQVNIKAYRAVGNAMNKNKYKDVPCHRVVESDGSIGGFVRGVDEKIRLLRKEEIEVVDGKIDLKKYGYFFK